MSDKDDKLAAKLALGEGVRILASHPCGLVALEKPEGLMSHPNAPEDRARSLIRADYDMKERRFHNLDKGPGEVFSEVFLLHRLDSATSGVILVSTSREILPAVRQAFERSKVSKVYNAIVRGRPAGIPKLWIDMVTRRHEGPGRHVRLAGGGGTPARTEQSLIRMDDNRFGLSLLLLKPLTGRTHQLRYQCTRRGHPILGDQNYGDFKFNRTFAKLPLPKRLFLHAVSIEIDFLHRGSMIRFEAESPLPDAFGQILTSNPDIHRLAVHIPNHHDLVKEQKRRLGRLEP